MIEIKGEPTGFEVFTNYLKNEEDLKHLPKGEFYGAGYHIKWEAMTINVESVLNKLNEVAKQVGYGYSAQVTDEKIVFEVHLKPAELPGTTRHNDNTVANNVEIAEKMLSEGEITTPEEYFNVIKKGNRQ